MAERTTIRYASPALVTVRALDRVVLSLAVSLLGGCRGCSRDKPFVPYTIDSAPSVSTSPPTPPAPSAGPSPGVDGGFARTIAELAPTGSTSWNVRGVAITAPPGRVLVSALALNEPGQPPAVAAQVSDGGSVAAEIILYRTDGSGKIATTTTLAKLPDALPTGPGCQHVVQLSQIGPQTLWVDAVALCKPQDPKRPARWLAALATTTTPAAKLELRTGDIALGERLAFDADASDRDGDGLDDLAIQVTLEGAPAPLSSKGSATASLRYLGRSGGLSREADEPAKSLRAQATWLAAQAAKRAAADETPFSSARVRRLYTMLCAEGGAPLVTMGDGSSLPCDPATAEDTRYAEARALVTAGDVTRGFALAARLRAARPKSKRVAELDAALEGAAPARKVKARPLVAIPTASSIAVPLAFEASGKLLVLTDDGIVRVDPATGQESPADGVARWSPRADLVGSLRVQGATDPCRGDFLRLVIAADGTPRELALPTLGGAAPACPGDPSVPVMLLDRNGDGLTVAILGEVFGVPADGERATPTSWPGAGSGQGTIRSLDGRWAAMSGSDRVLVRGVGRAEIWKPSPFFTLSACTAANDGKAVACTLERGAVLLTP